MAFSVGDFHDLLRLLEEHPEWRADLRRHVLTDDLIDLPGAVRELVEAQARTELRLSELAEAQRQTEQVLGDLGRRVDGLASRVDSLVQAVERTAHQLGTLGGRVGRLDGKFLEWDYEKRAASVFSRLARRLRVVDRGRVAEMVDDAIDAGQLTDAEREEVLRADLVLSGRRREDGQEAYFVVEISVGVGLNDVTRAFERAQILAKLGRPAVPVVAGEWIDHETALAANADGVAQIMSGRSF